MQDRLECCGNRRDIGDIDQSVLVRLQGGIGRVAVGAKLWLDGKDLGKQCRFVKRSLVALLDKVPRGRLGTGLLRLLPENLQVVLGDRFEVAIANGGVRGKYVNGRIVVVVEIGLRNRVPQLIVAATDDLLYIEDQTIGIKNKLFEATISKCVAGGLRLRRCDLLA